MKYYRLKLPGKILAAVLALIFTILLILFLKSVFSPSYMENYSSGPELQSNGSDTEISSSSESDYQISQEDSSNTPVNEPEGIISSETAKALGMQGTIYFLPDSYLFADGERTKSILDIFIEVSKSTDEVILVFEGNIADTGGISTNGHLLSFRRAMAVASYLIGNDVDQSKFIFIDNGIDKQVNQNRTSEERAQNRRVDIYFVLAE